LVVGQIADSDTQEMDRIWNIGGGLMNSMSLAELSGWCSRRINKRHVERQLDHRPFDVPWIVMNAALAKTRWGWQPAARLEEILEEIADHAEKNPEWLQAFDG
jgi:CDP-paratose 2-epimerase